MIIAKTRILTSSNKKGVVNVNIPSNTQIDVINQFSNLGEAKSREFTSIAVLIKYATNYDIGHIFFQSLLCLSVALLFCPTLLLKFAIQRRIKCIRSKATGKDHYH